MEIENPSGLPLRDNLHGVRRPPAVAIQTVIGRRYFDAQRLGQRRSCVASRRRRWPGSRQLESSRLQRIGGVSGVEQDPAPPSGAFGRFSLGRICPASGTLPRRVPRTQPGTPAAHSSFISRSSGTVFPARICRRDSKISSIVFTLRRSSRARAIAYRTNSDFEGKPRSLDAAARSFACSFVSLRLIVSTRIVIRGYYLTLRMALCT